MNNKLNIDFRNPSVVRKLGIAALTKELGVVGMAYFIRQFDMGSGDYTAERDELLEGVTTMDEILEGVRKIAPEEENRADRQLKALKTFRQEIRACDEPLDSELDEIISQRVNIDREIDL